jgi:sugar-phosphatase
MEEIRLGLPAGEITCRAVLFDMDGVLVDSLPTIERHLREWADRHGLDADEVFAASHGRTNRELVRVVAPRLDAAAEADGLVAEDMRDVAGLVACPGARALVDRLPSGSWAVVTSAYRPVARARLEEAGFPEPEVLVTADDVAKGKPNPAPYLTAAHRLGVPARDCVVFEDAPSGVESARRAAATVVGVAGTIDAGALATRHTVAGLDEVR